MSDFLVFDEARLGDAERHVQFERNVTMRVDATDEWISVPVRCVFTDDGLSGFTFEIGPYSVCGADARALANALANFGKVSGEFRAVGGAA
ncbi:hypothetical protein ACHIPZ_13615 [Antrihabitans sp. NCIMB 15449]|uniref:Uncharacterized protein n=1 Tax=Antrihabitans spumae TaxID=3373370 RepID=A0ABW7JN27_9NOCA